ncbi:hypothetical protein C1H46_017483 [Malus baccata]|uniref:SBP-type domain-containing protein n=1 Tax=Malus baccata TaxID=106549 RepID=A0A540MDR0_MALBA|nr:hypothetical protein C1H46_017483 [Malus baccata]
MEAFGGGSRKFYSPTVSDLKAVGKKSVEWDLNDWKWDGDLFTASPLNAAPSDCRSRQLFPLGPPETPSTAGLSNTSSSGLDDTCPVNEKGKRELEKRRRDSIVENEELNNEVGSLNLKLGEQAYPIMEGEVQTGKKTKIVGTTLNRAVCQVEDCKADLSNAKDYHRRHKVCDMHSKATKAPVGNVLQRFCQQCSRFHVLQEFDEGRRSCRRRLAGHNRRRRKTHPDTVVNEGSLNDERGSSYLLISLLRILSNMHSNSSDQTKDQDLLSHLLKNLANLSGTVDGRNMSALLTASQGLLNGGTSIQTAQKVPDTVSNGCEPSKPSVSASKMDDYGNREDPSRPIQQCSTVPASDFRIISSVDADHGGLQVVSGVNATKPFPSKDRVPSTSVAPEATTGRIQLNGIDLNNTYDDSQDYLASLGNSQAPVNSGTVSHGFPLRMRQDLQKSSPPQTSGTSYSTSSSSSGEVQSRTDRIVFKLFGKDPNDLPFVLRSQILDWLSHSPTDIESYIRPGCIILTVYLRLEKSTWEELCCNLGSILKRLLHAANDPFWTTGWVLLCALEGKYLVQETCYDLVDGADTTIENDQLQCLRFSCSIPNVTGRGFIEVLSFA